VSNIDHGVIVVVDDSWLILEKIRDSLRNVGYEVRITTSPATASSYCRSADLAIVDFHMPQMNGAAAVRHLRAGLPAGQRCEFYLYTSDRDVAAKYQEHGFDGAFLRKGDEEALLPQVEAVFRTIKMRKLAAELRRSRRG
jgi:CheY-like chemotaxis protein